MEFYRRIIKDFAKIANPFCKIHEKYFPFDFNKSYLRAFNYLKERLVTTPIIVVPEWNLSFKVICNVTRCALGAILNQRKDKLFYLVYYVSKTLNVAKKHYTIMEQELLTVVYTFGKFWAYLLGSKVMVSH